MKEDNEYEYLTDESYEEANLVENPILRPIANTDKILESLSEVMEWSLSELELTDKWVMTTISAVPENKNTMFGSKILSLYETMQRILKLQDTEIANLKACIKEMVEVVYEKYLIAEESEVKQDVGEILEVEDYLDMLSRHKDKRIAIIAEKIKEYYYDDQTDIPKKKKFEYAISRYHKDQPDKQKKEIAVKIMRMEL